jgi:hypothetical protein
MKISEMVTKLEKEFSDDVCKLHKLTVYPLGDDNTVERYNVSIGCKVKKELRPACFEIASGYYVEAEGESFEQITEELIKKGKDKRGQIYKELESKKQSLRISLQLLDKIEVGEQMTVQSSWEQLVSYICVSKPKNDLFYGSK